MNSSIPGCTAVGIRSKTIGMKIGAATHKGIVPRTFISTGMAEKVINIDTIIQVTSFLNKTYRGYTSRPGINEITATWPLRAVNEHPPLGQ